jgi:hypothetical protein
MIYLSMMIKAAAVYASRHPTPLQPTDDDAFDPSRTTELHGQVAWTGPTSSRSSMAGARARQPEARHHHLIDRSPALLDLRLGGRHCAEQLGPTKRGAFGSSGSGRGDNASSDPAACPGQQTS